MGELEKEKTMKELEMRDALSQHRVEISTRDALVQGLRDRDHENRATIDLQRKVGSSFYLWKNKANERTSHMTAK